MSLTSLCLIEENPPVEQDKAWSMLNEWPQLQCEGWLLNGQSYLSDKASLNADLWRTKPWLSMGSAVSHTELPFSCESSMHL